MVYRTQNYCFFFHLRIFLGGETRLLGNWICFRSQVKVGEKTTTQLGPLERANLSPPCSVQNSQLFCVAVKELFPVKSHLYNCHLQ
jgi:hypothetical protein